MAEGAVLVTGGTGFIGSHVVRLLVGEGRSVVASNASGTRRHLEDLADRVPIVSADLGSFTSVLRLVEAHRPEVIFHIGAMLAPACDADPETGIRINALGTHHILEAARLFGVRQVVFASSMSVLTGAHGVEPVVNDSGVTRPDFVYGAAKLFSENIGLFYKRQYAFDYRGLRLPNVIGRGAETHGYLEYINKAIAESASGRAYSVYVAPQVRVPILYVADAARAFVELARAPVERIKTVNYIVLGPNPSPTAQELVDCVRAKVPGARLGFDVDQNVSSLIERVTGHPYQDACAREEWGWQHRYEVHRIIDEFVAEEGRQRAR